MSNHANTYTRDEPLFAHAAARQKGEAAGQVCLDNTRQTHQDWPELAYRALTTYIIIHRGKEPWTAEDANEFVAAMRYLMFQGRKPSSHRLLAAIDSPGPCLLAKKSLPQIGDPVTIERYGSRSPP